MSGMYLIHLFLILMPLFLCIRSVTMLPIEEAEEEDSTMRSSAGSVSTGISGSQTEKSPLGGDIQEAIEKGDWAAVGATAAILASSDSSAVSSVDENAGSSSILSSHASTMDDDDIRAAEIDQLVETGNWDVSSWLDYSCNIFYDFHSTYPQSNIISCRFNREWWPLLLDMPMKQTRPMINWNDLFVLPLKAVALLLQLPSPWYRTRQQLKRWGLSVLSLLVTMKHLSSPIQQEIP